MAPTTKKVEKVKEVEEIEEDEDDVDEEDDTADENEEVKKTVGPTDKKSKKDLKKAMQDQQKEKSKKLLLLVDDIFTFTNRLVGKTEKVGGDITLNKKSVMSMQRSVINELRREFDELRKFKPVQSSTPRNNNYPQPLFFKKELVAFLKDPACKLARNDVQVNRNSEDFQSEVEYKGEHLGSVLAATSKASIDVGDVNVGFTGLASKAIVNTLFNYYLVANKMKGVMATSEVKGKDGKMPTVEKVKFSYWKPDALMIKHFGPILEELVKNQSAKDSNVSMECLDLGAIMALSAKLTDGEKNSEMGKKQILRDPELTSIVSVDQALMQALYDQVKGTVKH